MIIELISNIASSSITNFTKRFPVPPTAVSGVGDQAYSFSQSLGAGKVNEGVVATKGSTLVSMQLRHPGAFGNLGHESSHLLPDR